jgi:hypothetical protein
METLLPHESAKLGGMADAADYLNQALSALRRQRADLDRQIRVIERTVNELSSPVVQVFDSDSGTGEDAGSVRVLRQPPRAVREIALEIAHRGEVFSLEDVVQAVREEGNDAQYASVSSILSRLKGEGILQRGPRRGTYVTVTTSVQSSIDDLDDPQDPPHPPLVLAERAGAAVEEGR